MINSLGEASAAFALFFGVLVLVARWSGRLSAVLLFVGIVIAAVQMVSAYGLSSFSARSVSTLDLPGRQWPDGWWKNMPPEMRADSIGIARSEFIYRGRLIEYGDKTGNAVRFSPGEDDIRQHDQHMALRMQLEHWHELGSTTLDRWIVLVSMALLLGYGAGRYAQSAVHR